MNCGVFNETGVDRVGTRAVQALEGPVKGVHHHVPLEVRLLVERARALGALKRALATVHHHVLLQVRLLREGAVAYVALEGSLPRVNHHVFGQVRPVVERLGADGTLVLLGEAVLVHAQALER